MTTESLQALSITEKSDEMTLLYTESALDWLSDNTTLKFDKNNPESLTALPAGAKLFIAKYRQIAEADSTVASESINGLSQSFNTSDKSALIYNTAQQLLGKYLKSAFSFVPATNKWR